MSAGNIRAGKASELQSDDGRLCSAEGSRVMERLKGKGVLIKGEHPWAGHTGKCKGEIETIVGKGFVVELDNGMKCTVFNEVRDQYEVVE